MEQLTMVCGTCGKSMAVTFDGGDWLAAADAVRAAHLRSGHRQ